SISADIDFEFGAVAKITRAPPSLCSSCAAFMAELSIYRCAPSFLASRRSAALARLPQLCSRISARTEFPSDQARQRVECSDACAQQRRRIGWAKRVRNPSYAFDWRDHVFLISAIEVDAGNRC